MSLYALNHLFQIPDTNVFLFLQANCFYIFEGIFLEMIENADPWKSFLILSLSLYSTFFCISTSISLNFFWGGGIQLYSFYQFFSPFWPLNKETTPPHCYCYRDSNLFSMINLGILALHSPFPPSFFSCCHGGQTWCRLKWQCKTICGTENHN